MVVLTTVHVFEYYSMNTVVDLESGGESEWDANLFRLNKRIRWNGFAKPNSLWPEPDSNQRPRDLRRPCQTPGSQAPAGSQPRAPKKRIYQHVLHLTIEESFFNLFLIVIPGALYSRARCRAVGLGVLKRTKNGQRSRADGGSIDPNALDRENGAA